MNRSMIIEFITNDQLCLIVLHELSFNGLFKALSGEVGCHLSEVILAFVHELMLVTAFNIAKRSLQILKCQSFINNM